MWNYTTSLAMHLNNLYNQNKMRQEYEEQEKKFVIKEPKEWSNNENTNN